MALETFLEPLAQLSPFSSFSDFLLARSPSGGHRPQLPVDASHPLCAGHPEGYHVICSV